MKNQKKQQGIHLKANTQNWWWVLVSRNGRVLATSEMYSSKSAAVKGIISVAKFFNNNNHYYDHTKNKINIVVI